LNILDTLTGWAQAHPHFAFAVVLLLAFSESLPIFGGFVPGTALIIGIAAIVPKEWEYLTAVTIAAAVGASLGDGISFWLGHHFQRDVLGHWPLKNHPELVAKSENFLAKNGEISVLFARFLPPVRALVPLFAGILEMPVSRYVLANIAAAILWAPAHIVFGALLGSSIDAIAPEFGRFMMIAAAVTAVSVAFIWFVRRLLNGRNGEH
jgi:undecaprenyl-diphosphatase